MTAGGANYIVYTVTDPNQDSINQSRVVLSKVQETALPDEDSQPTSDTAYGLVHPTDSNADTPYLVLDNDANGDLDFDAWVDDSDVIHVAWVSYTDKALDAYEDALRALLTGPDRPTAILVSDDILAVVLEQFCSKLGLRIPKDLSIVSFNNSLFSRITNPPLTTVDVNPYQLGIEAASQTINHIENPNLLATKIIVPHQLIVRESCCPPPENRTAALPGGAL